MDATVSEWLSVRSGSVACGIMCPILLYSAESFHSVERKRARENE